MRAHVMSHLNGTTLDQHWPDQGPHRFWAAYVGYKHTPMKACCAGMSTFSTRGGLYERAQKRFAVQDGKKLFTFAFFEKQRLEAMVGTVPHVTLFPLTSCPA